MAKGIGAVDFDEIQALVRMTQRSDPLVAKIAVATLAVVESRRDAEVRAAAAEVALATEREKLSAIRNLLVSLGPDADPAEALRQIAKIAIS